MKHLFFYFLILTSSISNCQENFIPKIPFQNKSETNNVYIKLLNLQDENSLIILTRFFPNYKKNGSTNFVVFNNDGKVTKYQLFDTEISKKKEKIIKYKVSKKKSKYYWQFLNDFIKHQFLNIDSSKLNITSKPNSDGTSTFITVSHSYSQTFEITQGKEYSTFGTINAGTFIQEEFPGFEERKKLVLLIQKFEELFKK